MVRSTREINRDGEVGEAHPLQPLPSISLEGVDLTRRATLTIFGGMTALTALPSDAHAQEPSPNDRVDQSDLINVPVPFAQALDELDQLVGPAYLDVPRPATDASLQADQQLLLEDNSMTTISELCHGQVRMQERHAHRQREHHRTTHDTASLREAFVLEQEETYYEYLPKVIRSLIQVLQRYQDTRTTFPGVTSAQYRQELQAQRLCEKLNTLLRKRLAFANALLVQGKRKSLVEQRSTNVAQLDLLQRQISDAFASDHLTPALRQILSSQSEEARRAAGNGLNHEIIRTLAVPRDIDGLEQGYLPQKMLLTLFREQLSLVLAQERALAAKHGLIQARRLLRQLENKKKDGWSEVEKSKYETLQRTLEAGKGMFVGLERQRTDTTTQLIETTQLLALYHLDLGRLTTIQHHFGDAFDPTGVGVPSDKRAPEALVQALEEHMNMVKDFHWLSLDRFAERLEQSYVQIGFPERVEHFSNHELRPRVLAVAQRLAHLISAPVPESFGLQGMAYYHLVGPLETAMGWPAGAASWDELTDEELQVIEEKAKSVIEELEKLRPETIHRLRETIALLRGLNPSNDLRNVTQKKPLPSIDGVRITSGNIEQLKREHGAAALYELLLAQCEQDLGKAQTNKGVLGELASSMIGVNRNIGMHVAVGKAYNELGDQYWNLEKDVWKLIITLIVALKAAEIAGPSLFRMAGRTTKRVGKSVVHGTKSVLRKIRPSTRKNRHSGQPPPAAKDDTLGEGAPNL